MKSPESSLISGLQEPIVEIVKLLLLINTLLSLVKKENKLNKKDDILVLILIVTNENDYAKNIFLRLNFKIV